MKPLDVVEPRIPISSLPFTISAGGSYYLTKSLSGAQGITITATRVTLDLNGFSLTGPGAGDRRPRALLANGPIRHRRAQWLRVGMVWTDVSLGRRRCAHRGDHRLLQHRSGSIFVSRGEIVDCSARANIRGWVSRFPTDNVRVLRSEARENGTGIDIVESHEPGSSTDVSSRGTASGWSSARNWTLARSVISFNSGSGVKVGEGCSVLENSLHYNVGDGILVDVFRKSDREQQPRARTAAGACAVPRPGTSSSGTARAATGAEVSRSSGETSPRSKPARCRTSPPTSPTEPGAPMPKTTSLPDATRIPAPGASCRPAPRFSLRRSRSPAPRTSTRPTTARNTPMPRTPAGSTPSRSARARRGCRSATSPSPAGSGPRTPAGSACPARTTPAAGARSSASRTTSPAASAASAGGERRLGELRSRRRAGDDRPADRHADRAGVGREHRLDHLLGGRAGPVRREDLVVPAGSGSSLRPDARRPPDRSGASSSSGTPTARTPTTTPCAATWRACAPRAGSFALAAQACVASRDSAALRRHRRVRARRSRRLVPRAERQLRRGVELRRSGRAAGRTAGSRDRGLGRRLSVKARCAPRLTRA